MLAPAASAVLLAAALSAGADSTLRRWDAASGREAAVWRAHTAAVTGVVFLPDGRRALSAGWDRGVVEWDVRADARLKTWSGHTWGVYALALSPDGRTASHLIGHVDNILSIAVAPEQHLGEAYDSSDIYSLGVMLYEMVSGEIPFRGPDFLAQKERLAFKPLSGLVEGLSTRVDGLLAATLHPDPKNRIEHALDFYQKLLGA